MDKSKSIVWKQFKSRKIGYYSFLLILFMFAVSIFAPFIANNKPLYLYSKFPSLYDYYFRSARKNLDVLLSSAGRKDELREREQFYIDGFNKQKEIIKELNDTLVKVGNRYDNVIKQIYNLEGLIEKEAKSGGNTADLIEKKKELEKQRNEVGGEKNQLQAEIIKQTNIQNFDYNQPLLGIRFMLDSEKTMASLLKGLSKMKYMVSRDIDSRINDIIADLMNLSAESLDRSLLENAGSKLDLLSLANIRGELKYRGIFPVLGSLGLLDIYLMICYCALIILLITGIHNLSRINRVALVLLISFIAALLFYLLFPKWPAQDYKMLLKSSIEEGFTESFGIFAPVPFGMNENNFYESFQKPMFIGTDGLFSRHILGTDDNGRSIISRMIWGSRVSLSVGFVSVSLYVIIGIIIGSIAGYYGKWIDIAISRFIEIVMCFPSFFLILTVIAFIGPSIYNIMIVIGITRWTGIARLVRGEFLRIKNLDYVQAGKALGASSLRSIARHILPNSLTPVLVSAAFGFAGAVLVEAGLSFLGFGVQDPMASWGQMLSASKGHPVLYWWMFITPGFALFVTVTLYNLVGNALRDAIDPRLRM